MNLYRVYFNHDSSSGQIIGTGYSWDRPGEFRTIDVLADRFDVDDYLLYFYDEYAAIHVFREWVGVEQLEEGEEESETESEESLAPATDTISSDLGATFSFPGSFLR